MMNRVVPFHLFKTCIPVRGYNRSVIYDLQRNNYDYIPNDLYDILIDYEGVSFEKLSEDYSKENQIILFEYFEFLLKKEYIYFSLLDNSHFPEISKEARTPYEVNTLVLDLFKKENLEEYIKLKNYLKDCNIGAVSIRIFHKEFDIDSIEKYLDLFSNSTCRSIEFWLPFESDTIVDIEVFLEELTIKNPRLFRINIYNHISERIITLENSHSQIIYYKSNLTQKVKTKVCLENMIVNFQLFVESLKFNTYYYKKLYIKDFNLVFNSPMEEIFLGTLDDVNLDSAISSLSNSSIFNIKKDDIEDCKICEFRYMCTDSQLPVLNKDKTYTLPIKCNYNPVTSKWID